MKRHLLILSLLLLTATSASAQTAYAVWCAGAKTLYFDYTTSSITAGSTYQGQTVTNVWSGEDVLNTNFFYYGGKWGVTCCVWYDAAHTTAERVVIKDAFSGAPVKKTTGWFYEFGNLTVVEGLGNISGDYLEDMERMFYNCHSLTTLDMSGFDISHVKSMALMFAYCSSLTTIYCNATVASDVGNAMFSNCTSLVGAVAFDSSKTGSMMANPAGYFTRKVNPNDANQNRIIGDVNGDKKVDISDIVAVINNIAGDPTYKETAKVNDDDKVDISDIVAIINIIASGSSQTETDPAVEAGLCPDTHHPHTIDLGDGGLWSCCNVGASAPWECGGYYAWGETEEKSAYDWNTYTHCDGSKETCRDLGSDIAGTQYDVAHVKWGDGWQMPSKEQLELLTKSSHRWTWTRINGVFGRKVIGANGASIFLPVAAPYEDGFYWSSTQDPDISSSAFGLEFDSYFVTMPTTKRYLGKSVRPVKQTDAAVKAGLCPDINHPHVIDLGIGVKFACCNVGTSAPWAIGYYYAWGETVEKHTYDWTTYTHCDGNAYSCRNIGNDISGTQYDVAYVKWGEGWGMPSSEQIKLVIQNCKNERISVNGVDGLKVTGPNNKSIFLPATGYRTENTTDGVGNGYYWTSTQDTDYSTYCYLFSFGSAGNLGVDEDRRSTGITVRPVYETDAAVETGLCPDTNHPHAIDLGDGTKWSCCNVGASVPWENGGYYAWGETEEKDYYDWTTYSHCDGSKETCHDLGSDIAGTQYDVAHVKWGNGWKMPSNEQLGLLKDNCSSEWTSVNGVNGRKVTGANGASIFLPAAGYRWDDITYSVGSHGFYWSSTQYPTNSNNAYYLRFYSDYFDRSYFYRYYGRSVRPVTE